MKIFPTVFFLLLPLIMSGAACAPVTNETTITPQTLRPLAAWVEQATHVPVEPLPITVASNAKLKIAMNLSGVQKASAAAAYLPGQIIVNSTIWRADSVRMQSYLVHELVHHAQLLSLKKYPCGAAKEREAYTLQNQWLLEHGEAPLVTAEWIDKISACTGSSDGDTD